MFGADISQPIGAKINYHLLETNRVCGAKTFDSNFHVFYGLILGAKDELLKNICLDRKISYKVSFVKSQWKNDMTANSQILLIDKFENCS